jgi:hypothetical protein
MSFSLSADSGHLLLTSAALFLLFLIGAAWLFRYTDFVSILRQHLRRFAPFYFVIGPSAITYLCFCGAASASSVILFYKLPNNYSQEYANQHGLYTLFHWIEYTCSFLGAFGFACLIRWVGLPRLWTAILFVSLSVCAAYRTARVGSGPDFEAGPEILLSPQWLDVIPVALGIGLFLLLQSKLREINSCTSILP